MSFIVACACGNVFESLWGPPMCSHCGEMVPDVISDAMDAQYEWEPENEGPVG
jgi:hypothetical protein